MTAKQPALTSRSPEGRETAQTLKIEAQEPAEELEAFPHLYMCTMQSRLCSCISSTFANTSIDRRPALSAR